MATEASIVKRYEIADLSERVDIMLNNYSSFEAQLAIEFAGIEYRIKEERAYRRRASRGELGIRVQTSNISDPTYEAAAENIMIESALKKKNFDDNLFDGVDDCEEIKREVYIMEVMQLDFGILRRQLSVLKKIDRKILLDLYEEGLEIQEIADEQGIDYESVRTRTKRAKGRLRMKMLDFWSEHQRRGL